MSEPLAGRDRRAAREVRPGGPPQRGGAAAGPRAGKRPLPGRQRRFGRGPRVVCRGRPRSRPVSGPPCPQPSARLQRLVYCLPRLVYASHPPPPPPPHLSRPPPSLRSTMPRPRLALGTFTSASPLLRGAAFRDADSRSPVTFGCGFRSGLARAAEAPRSGGEFQHADCRRNNSHGDCSTVQDNILDMVTYCTRFVLIT